jgi:DNA adenine methylase
MELFNGIIKSPLRYPGGKSKALKRILPLIPQYDEFREPMVGGGSVFFALKQKYPNKKYWINDINTELFYFWKYCKEKPDELIAEIRKVKQKYKKGVELYKYLKSHKETLTELQRASRFFILNRISFSGLVDAGGYSQQAFKKRFTNSSIERICYASKTLQDVKITNTDYWDVVKLKGKNAFIFLDPPYMSNKEAKLYGEKGTLHVNFKHDRFAKHIKNSIHKWLITYDNCSGVKKLYTYANAAGLNIKLWKLQYGINNGLDNSQKKKASIGNELFIFNYKINANSKVNL